MVKLDSDTSLDDNQEILYLHFHQLFFMMFPHLTVKLNILLCACLLKIYNSDEAKLKNSWSALFLTITHTAAVMLDWEPPDEHGELYMH